MLRPVSRCRRACLPKIRALIAKAAAAKIPHVIVFSGNREGQDDHEGERNVITALKSLAPEAERLQSGDDIALAFVIVLAFAVAAEDDDMGDLGGGGYLKRTPIDTYQRQTRGGKGRIGMSTRAEDNG